VPVALLGRLAVDQGGQGRGLGSALLRDAVLRVVGAAETIGVRALLVHAVSEEAKAFYERWGFRASAIDPMTLMVTIGEAQKMLGRARFCGRKIPMPLRFLQNSQKLPRKPSRYTTSGSFGCVPGEISTGEAG